MGTGGSGSGGADGGRLIDYTERPGENTSHPTWIRQRAEKNGKSYWAPRDTRGEEIEREEVREVGGKRGCNSFEGYLLKLGLCPNKGVLKLYGGPNGNQNRGPGISKKKITDQNGGPSQNRGPTEFLGFLTDIPVFFHKCVYQSTPYGLPHPTNITRSFG